MPSMTNLQIIQAIDLIGGAYIASVVGSIGYIMMFFVIICFQIYLKNSKVFQ